MQSTTDGLVDVGSGVQFNLLTRRPVGAAGDLANDRAASVFLDRPIGTPEELMTLAAEGRLTKGVLVNLLALEQRRPYLDACAAIEKQFTDDCAREGEPCLEAGCAVEGEICLQPLLRAEVDYHKACAAEWIEIFRHPRNRIDVWKR